MRLVPSTVPNAVVKAVPLHIVPDLAPMLVASSTRSLERLLERHGVDTSEWKTGKAKSVENLFGEMQRGEAVLRIDPSGALCRCLNVVKVVILPDLNFPVKTHFAHAAWPGSQVRVCRPENPHEHLVEAVQVWPDGRQKKRGRLLSETLRPTEEPVEGALRGLLEELGSIATAANIEIEEASLTTWRERIDSPSYPTLPSEYTLYQVSARVHGLPSTNFRTEEACDDTCSTEEEGPMVHMWEWRRDVEQLVKQLRTAIKEREAPITILPEDAPLHLAQAKLFAASERELRAWAEAESHLGEPRPTLGKRPQRPQKLRAGVPARRFDRSRF